jgi:hypothetical protein
MSNRSHWVLSINECVNTNHNCLEFEGPFLESFGSPELTGSWLVWGPPKNGKTRFVMQLCKYMTKFGRVGYNSIEEGNSQTIKTAIIETGIEEVKGRILFMNKMPIKEMITWLEKRRSPDIVVIDSIQFSQMKYADYIKLRERYPSKLFILISHAEGREPAGRIAKSIRYDSFIAIHVKGFKAYPISRYGGGAVYTIWKEGAENALIAEKTVLKNN